VNPTAGYNTEAVIVGSRWLAAGCPSTVVGIIVAKVTAPAPTPSTSDPEPAQPHTPTML